ncbi:MAG: hypothetical protein RL757_2698 [Bacteroidota bacterium]|jgi:hypothetical protein
MIKNTHFNLQILGGGQKRKNIFMYKKRLSIVRQ